MSKQPIIPCAFSFMLIDFHETIKDAPAVSKIHYKLIELRQDAEINPELNLRQKEAIIARVDNYINGTYGNTKLPEHYEQSKADKTK